MPGSPSEVLLAPSGLSLERVLRTDFRDSALRDLYPLANELMAEPVEHFLVHAYTNDELHVFRRGTEVVGFQFWRSVEGADDLRIVLGGKLRIRPHARRHGLHLVAGLTVLLEQRRAHPDARLVRIGIASVFGFVSIARRLAHYEFVRGDRPSPDVVDAADELTRVSDYQLDRSTGRVDVGIRMTDAQLGAYPREFFDKPEARAYIERNPEFASNGCYLAYAFDVDDANLRALAEGAAEAALGAGEPSRRAGRSLLSP